MLSLPASGPLGLTLILRDRVYRAGDAKYAGEPNDAGGTMEENVVIMLYIAVPVVLLVSAFVYYITQRDEDIEEVSQDHSHSAHRDQHGE